MLQFCIHGLVQEGPQADEESATAEKPSRVPEGLWVKCPDCAQVLYNKDLESNLHVCPKCAHHFRISAADRLRALFDGGQWTEHFPDLTSNDPLHFTDTKAYRDRLRATITATGMKDAVIIATGRLDGLESSSRRWSMRSSAAAWAWSWARRSREPWRWRSSGGSPLLIVSCSGGARMMEGALSLMQMAKISAALARLDRAGLPFISILTDPTTGGVTASFAMLGDLNIAEPKALIGFAGPRVIEQTIRQKLPEGFQRSEFLVDHGMVDLIVDRREMKAVSGSTLRFMGAESAPDEPPVDGHGGRRRDGDVSATVARTPLRARNVRGQARARQHLTTVLGARASRADVYVAPRRRHQRQGFGHGDGSCRARRRGPPRGPLHLASPRGSRRTVRHRSGSG